MPGLPTISAPTGGGAIRGVAEKLAVAPSGAATLSVPIPFSPARALSPDLELRYDSSSGNGPFGIGWHLSAPSVTRKTDKGLPRYADDDESDVFVLAGAEDLVPLRRRGALLVDVRGEYRVQRYRPRVEAGFARIERFTHVATGDSHFVVMAGDGTTRVFGRSAQARVADPGDPRRVFSWLLEETRDEKGNIVAFGYKAEDGAGVDRSDTSEAHRFDPRFSATAARYLKSIRYGNARPFDASTFRFEVVLDYGEHDDDAPTPAETRAWPVRRDRFSSYRAGFEVRTYRLCRRILTFHRFDELGPEPMLVRSTELRHVENDHLAQLVRVQHAGFRCEGGALVRDTHPALSFEYAAREVAAEVHVLDRESMIGIEGGVDGVSARWVDLDGEGIPGVLCATDGALYYKANLGGGKLAPPRLLRVIPSTAHLAQGGSELVDLDGDGRLELATFAPPTAGFYARTDDDGFAPFVPFERIPSGGVADPNARLLDVDGDGIPDLVVTKDDVVVIHRSRGKQGFDAPLFAPAPRGGIAGPAFVFADATETIQLADMTGDGLVDVVRVTNGEVCYWPNLGYGRFGRKVTMARSPRFGPEDTYDPRRVRFADLDGSGTSDLVYLDEGGARLWFNESGNGFAGSISLAFPSSGRGVRVDVVDLLGTGTACLVWSSAIPGDGPRSIRYVDLFGGKKPHLLVRVDNGTGGEQSLEYAPSTRFYLEDEAASRPWLTKLPFVVHVVARVEHVDRVSATKLVTRYRYRHGWFDGVERELGGFARVDRWDAETIGAVRSERNESGDLVLPPVRTSTWYHTGKWLEHEVFERELAKEYWRGDDGLPLLADTLVPRGLAPAEEREAARALRGRVLREEIYAEDGTPETANPYTVSERSYALRVLERAEHGSHAVVFVHPRERLDAAYERRRDDPRTSHEMVLDVDDFGNVTRALSIAYPRRAPEHEEQARAWVTLTERTLANVSSPRVHRIGVPVASTTSELTGVPASRVLCVDLAREVVSVARPIPFPVTASGRVVERRVVAQEHTLYYRDDLEGPLPEGEIGTRALPYETYRLALPAGLVDAVFGERLARDVLVSEAGYVEDGEEWLAPSGRLVFDPSAFYLPVEGIDPFGRRERIRYDAHALAAVEAEDALGNRTTAEIDYRVLAPALVSDPNGNRIATRYDALARPIAIARMGKAGEDEGDSLDDPTIRIEYQAPRDAEGAFAPAYVRTLAREDHRRSDTRWQESYEYVDGEGRSAMKKLRVGPQRWIGSGRTVLDNKGNVVKKYEPYFSDTPAWEDERGGVPFGVTPIFHYDALGRPFRTDLPEGTTRRVVFETWKKASWDENDGVLESTWYAERGAPAPDGPEPSDPERRAAWLSARHAGTPAREHFDALGRTFLVEGDAGGPSGLHRTRTTLDLAGNRRAVVDPRGVRVVDEQIFDALGRAISVRYADAGGVWTLPDVLGRPIRVWNGRGEILRNEFDELGRPARSYVRTGAGEEKLVQLVVYGEALSDGIERNLRTRVHRTYDGAGSLTIERVDFEGNPVETTRRFARDHRTAPDYRSLADRDSVDGILDDERFTARTTFDALGRLTSETTPDGSETRLLYDDAGRLRRVEARVRDAPTSAAFLEEVEHDARGRRTRVVHGNGTICRYVHDPRTFRLARTVTTRNDGAKLQDLTYVYDAAGSVVSVVDGVAFGNPRVGADARYAYDALYRLVAAEGREHPGQRPSFEDPRRFHLDHPNDMEALRRYRETYAYDPSGNIVEIAHETAEGRKERWIRRSSYGVTDNRLLASSGANDEPGAPLERFEYDVRGNVVATAHLAELRWDHGDRLVFASRRGGGEVHYAYDGSGARVRSVYEHDGIVEERLYLGRLEIYRKRTTGDARVVLERESLHVADEIGRIAIVETKTQDEDGGPTATRTRYQLTNHLGSSIFETDERGATISYEEYFPFGGTAFYATRASFDGDAKRYRYTGKERDEATGFYYHGARWLAPWLGRWMSPDPTGIADGTNVYAYCGNRPTCLVDPSGTQSMMDDPTGYILNRAAEEWSAMQQAIFGGHTEYDRDRGPVWSGPETWYPSGGVAGGIFRTITLRLSPAEEHPTQASQMGLVMGGKVVPFLGPAEELATGETAAPGIKASRAEAAVFLVLDVVPFALELHGAAVEARMLSAEGRVLESSAESYRVLVVGESSSFEYSVALAERNPEWRVVGTSFDPLPQVTPGGPANLELRGGVDATQLGTHFGPGSFEEIIFNAPRSHTGWFAETGDLIEDVLRSGRGVVSEGGSIRFSSGGGMPGTPRLNAHWRGDPAWPIPEGFNQPTRGPYLADLQRGVIYVPRNNAGQALAIPLEKIYWYVYAAMMGGGLMF